VIFGADGHEDDSHAEAHLRSLDLAEGVNDGFAGIHGDFDEGTFRQRREHFDLTSAERNVRDAAGEADGGVFGGNDGFDAAGLAREIAALFARRTGSCAVISGREGFGLLVSVGRLGLIRIVRIRGPFGEGRVPSKTSETHA
jgi:hypothetical protein